MTPPALGLHVALGALVGQALLSGCGPEEAAAALRRLAAEIEGAAALAAGELDRVAAGEVGRPN